MSYCRMGDDSDVYVIHSVLGGMVCHCLRDPILMTKQEMVEHLLDHRAEGWQVPERALARLYREIEAEEENDEQA